MAESTTQDEVLRDSALGPTRREIVLHYVVGELRWIVFPGIGLLIGLGIDRWFGLPRFPGAPWNWILGSAVTVWSLFWASWSWWALRAIGEGYPQESFGRNLLPPTKHLVVAGPYKYTRNPMVLGSTSFFAVPGLVFNSLGALLLLPLWFAWSVWYLRKWEEPGLVKRFGEDYLRYRRRVPLLWPRFRPPPDPQF